MNQTKRQRHDSRWANCKTCRHAERQRIDWQIATGVSATAIAAQYGLSHDSVSRHSKSHVSDALKRAAKLGPVGSEDELRRILAKNGKSITENGRALYAVLAARLHANYEAGADAAVCSISGRMTALLELLAKISKELQPPGGTTVTTNNIFMTPDYFRLEVELVEALRPFPEARQAVIEVLKKRDALGSRATLPAPMIDIETDEIHVSAE